MDFHRKREDTFRMNVSNYNYAMNFGKIYKTSSSVNSVLQVCSIANGYTHTNNKPLKDQIGKIFTDIDEGEAYSYLQDDETTYIFTGKESQEYQQLAFSTKEDIDSVVLKQWGSAYAEDHVEKMLDKFVKGVNKLLSKASNITELDIQTDPKTIKVKAIDIKA